MWNNLKTEYKIVFFFGVIFLVILIVYMINDNTIGKVADDIKKDGLIQCSNIKYENGVNYTERNCNINDDKSNNISVRYPQFNDKSDVFKNINNKIKEIYDDADKSIEYVKYDNEMILNSYTTVNYSIYNNNGIMSIVIEREYIKDGYKEKNNDFVIYNVDIENKKLISDTEFKKMFNINREYTTALKSNVISWYAVNHKYDYNNVVDAYRIDAIDKSIKSIVYSNISNLYLDNDGSINFIHQLYTPNAGGYRPYLFTYYNGKTTFKIIG